MLHRSGSIFDRHFGVDAMLIEEINGVGAQSEERRVGDLPNAFRSAIEAFGGDSFFKAELGGEDYLRAKRSDRFP